MGPWPSTSSLISWTSRCRSAADSGRRLGVHQLADLLQDVGLDLLLREGGVEEPSPEPVEQGLVRPLPERRQRVGPPRVGLVPERPDGCSLSGIGVGRRGAGSRPTLSQAVSEPHALCSLPPATRVASSGRRGGRRTARPASAAPGRRASVGRPRPPASRSSSTAPPRASSGGSRPPPCRSPLRRRARVRPTRLSARLTTRWRRCVVMPSASSASSSLRRLRTLTTSRVHTSTRSVESSMAPRAASSRPAAVSTTT